MEYRIPYSDRMSEYQITLKEYTFTMLMYDVIVFNYE